MSGAPRPVEDAEDHDPLADPAFLIEARARRPDALARFFDLAFPFIHAIAMRLTGDRTTAEDVTQDALHRIHRGLERLDPERPARPWIATITANLVRDHLRRVKRDRSVRFDPGDLESVVAGSRSSAGAAPPERPEEVAIRRERTQLLERAIAELSDDLREVLVLRVHGELDHDRIAETLGIRPDAARKRYSRALAEVREKMRRWES